MNSPETLDWLVLRFDILLKSPKIVNGVKIWNQTEVQFGRTYYKIYFVIEIDESFDRWDEINHTRYEITDYHFQDQCISFYANRYKEEHIENNFAWIVSIFNLLIKERPFDCNISEFKRHEI